MSLRAANSIIKWYHANFRFLLDSNLSVKPFYLTRGFVTFRSGHLLYLGTVDSFLSVSDKEPEIFLAFFMVKLKAVYVVSSSKLSMSKSAKIFHFIFGISLSESHAFSWIQKSAPVCENTILKLSVSNFNPLSALYLLIFLVGLILSQVLNHGEKSHNE